MAPTICSESDKIDRRRSLTPRESTNNSHNSGINDGKIYRFKRLNSNESSVSRIRKHRTRFVKIKSLNDHSIDDSEDNETNNSAMSIYSDDSNEDSLLNVSSYSGSDNEDDNISMNVEVATSVEDSGLFVAHAKKRVNTMELIEIAKKTISLIRRNQLLQIKLNQLQLETRAFVKSVLANPENKHMKNTTEHKTTICNTS